MAVPAGPEAEAEAEPYLASAAQETCCSGAVRGGASCGHLYHQWQQRLQLPVGQRRSLQAAGARLSHSQAILRHRLLRQTLKAAQLRLCWQAPPTSSVPRKRAAAHLQAEGAGHGHVYSNQT